MNRFAIFRMASDTTNQKVVISFIAVMNPLSEGEPIIIDAPDIVTAAKRAVQILDILKVETEFPLGFELIRFPRFFVGKLRDEEAERVKTETLVYRITTYEPVPAS